MQRVHLLWGENDPIWTMETARNLIKYVKTTFTTSCQLLIQTTKRFKFDQKKLNGSNQWISDSQQNLLARLDINLNCDIYI